jgi:hypothetical protein
MKIKSPLLSAILAALFATVVMFSGSAMAHCDQQPDPVQPWEEYGN